MASPVGLSVDFDKNHHKLGSEPPDDARRRDRDRLQRFRWFRFARDTWQNSRCLPTDRIRLALRFSVTE